MLLDFDFLKEIARSEIAAQRELVLTAQERLPGLGTEGFEVCGGYAAFMGANGLMTQAVGVGLDEPIQDEDLVRLTSFYRDRGSRIQFKLSPIVDVASASKAIAMASRIEEFDQMLVRPIEPLPQFNESPRFQVRRAREDEDALHTQTLREGFFGDDLSIASQDPVFQAIFHAPGNRPYLAFVDGVAAGGASMQISGKFASLRGASVKPEFRGMGIQKALIRTRTQDALEEGCSWLTVGTLPGSVSQLNMQKMGFAIAYTKISLEWD